MAQRDPLVEFQREGYDLFVGMMDSIKEESIGFLFNVEVTVEAAQDTDGDGQPDEVELFAKGLQAARTNQALVYSAPSETGDAVAVTGDGAPVATGRHRGGSEFDNVGRNDPCPCGSGKKFKRCHGAAA